MPNLSVRPAAAADVLAALRIYARARRFMAEHGNPTQWGDGTYPSRELLLDDVARGQLFAVEEEGRLCGVFAFIVGDDPTYAEIDGAWSKDEPYGTLHRVASDGTARGVFSAAVAFCEKRAGYLRIDTHEDNAPMRHLIAQHGFRPCGTIFIGPGAPRLAFDR